MSPRFEDAPPAPDATRALYEAVGWTDYARDPRLLEGLAASTYVTAAYEGERLLGLARCVSDGATIWFLQDLLVLPERQSAGLGRALLARCRARFAGVKRGVLLTEESAAGFYEREGWTRPGGLGVVTCWIDE